MNLISTLKGVFRRMFSAKDIEKALHINPTLSQKMKESIELWEAMYKDESPWINESNGNLRSLGLAAQIASEKSRTATIEMAIKVTGESELSKLVENCMNDLQNNIREQLEYGIALGGFIIKPYVVPYNGSYIIKFSYVKATDFYPLAFAADGSIIEAVFVEHIITTEAVYSKLEHHKRTGEYLNDLIVRNKAFKSETVKSQTNPAFAGELGQPIKLTDVPEWANIEPETTIRDVGMNLYSYFRMPESNNIDLNCPLGISGFSKAVDLIKAADEQYSNLLWEFEGGQLAIDVDRTAFNPVVDSTGRPTQVLPKLQERLFRKNMDLGKEDAYNVFSPDLRDASIINGLNNILMHIEDVCSMSRGTLSEVNYVDARTATEMRIIKQRSYSANCDIQKELQKTLEQVVDIVKLYCKLYNIVPSGKLAVSYSWDDSIIVDKDNERQNDMIEVEAGLMSRVEYRMKWYGETKDQAEEAIKTIQSEQEEALKLQQKIELQQQSDAQKQQDRKQRAYESRETTK